MGNWAKQARMALSQKNFTQAGDFYKLEGDYKAAIKAYMKGKNLVEAARIYESMGNVKKAEKMLKKNGAPRAFAEFLIRNNSPEKAIEIYLSHGMEFEAAELLERQNQLQQAAALYERLKFHEQAGLLYRKAKNFNKAIEMFTLAVNSLEKSANPNASTKVLRYQNWIANLHIGAKQFNRAGEIFEKIQQKEKAAKCFYKAGSHLKAAQMLIGIGQIESARTILAKVQNREARVLLGKIAMEQGDYREVIRLLKDTDHSRLLSEAYEHLGQYQEAAFHVEKLGDLKRAAEFYSRAGEYQKAAILYEQNGLFSEAAESYEKQKKYEHAARLYQLAKNHFKAGYCFFRVHRLEDALKHLQTLDEAHPDHLEATGIMAEIFFKQGVYSVARSLLEDLTANAVLDDAGMPKFYLLARCLEAEGHLEGAKKYYERLVAKKFDYIDTHVRLKRLQDSVAKVDHNIATVKDEISPYDVSVGDIIDNRFKILTTIGKGGMGFIFKVRDLSLDRDIALKMLIHDKGDFEELKVELLIARDLTHPYIIKVFDVGNWMKIGYFTMEYVNGRSLKEHILENSPDSLPKKIQLLIKICQGLQAAHEQDVVHRDIKPQNILIDANYDPKILDFGIARKLTHANQKKGISGSPKYMAPEQIQNLNIDPRTDIYAMGIVMFYMFTGKEPFLGRTPQEVMLLHLEKPLPDPLELNPNLPYWLSEIIRKCCQKSPDMRFNDMGELVNELRLNLMEFNE